MQSPTATGAERYLVTDVLRITLGIICSSSIASFSQCNASLNNQISDSALDLQLQTLTLWLRKHVQALMHRCKCYFRNVDERDLSVCNSVRISCPAGQSGGKHPNYKGISLSVLKTRGITHSPLLGAQTIAMLSGIIT